MYLYFPHLQFWASVVSYFFAASNMVHESFRGNRQNNFVTAALDPRLAQKKYIEFQFFSSHVCLSTVRRCSSSSSYTRYLWKRVNLTIWWLIFFFLAWRKRQCLQSANSFYYNVVFSPTIIFYRTFILLVLLNVWTLATALCN